jgi:DNA-binding NarL/FixJ family response regulator
MAPAAISRVLIVEDFDAYRDVVRSLINRQPAFLVIGEAATGLEAVEKAQQLKPDVVLMDIGLPKMSGFEAARLMKALEPAPKIIFLTAQTDIDLMEEALMLGACGFISKAHAGSELLPALEAAVCDETFIGGSVGRFSSKIATLPRIMFQK